MTTTDGIALMNTFPYMSDSIEQWPTLPHTATHHHQPITSTPVDDYSILHELNLMTEKIDSPTASQAELPALPRKRRASTPPPAPTHYKRPKVEPLAALPTSPVTLADTINDENTPTLPTPSRDQAAARRALRREVRKRHRSRPSAPRVKTEDPTPSGSTAAPAAAALALLDAPDKKAARAIRNRAAAMKSRVEAKQKMVKLEQDNERLAKTVNDLTASNKLLAAQIKALTRSLCPGPVTPARQQEILALTAQIHAESNNDSTTTPTSASR